MRVLGTRNLLRRDRGRASTTPNAGSLRTRSIRRSRCTKRTAASCPELASRDHVRRVVPLMREDAGRTRAARSRTWTASLTRRAGARGRAARRRERRERARATHWASPVIGVHHLEGHLLSPLLADPQPAFPFVALLVSGGHTQLFDVAAVGRYRLLGDTQDDAAGEAFDKTAKLLGSAVSGRSGAGADWRSAGAQARCRLPRPMLDSGDLDFSFSGLKTAVLTLARARSRRRRPAVAVRCAQGGHRARIPGGGRRRARREVDRRARRDRRARVSSWPVALARIASSRAQTHRRRSRAAAAKRVLSRPRVLHRQRRDDRARRRALRTRVRNADDYRFDVQPRWPARRSRRAERRSAVNGRSCVRGRRAAAGCWRDGARTEAPRSAPSPTRLAKRRRRRTCRAAAAPRGHERGDRADLEAERERQPDDGKHQCRAANAMRIRFRPQWRRLCRRRT